MAITLFRGQYEFLRNFYPSLIIIDGITYPTAEHAYVSYKVESDHLRRQIAKIPTAPKVKEFGRQVKARDDWNDIRIDAMREVQYHKYNIPHLARKLLATGAQDLCEGNWWHDNFWGNCTCQNKDGKHPECLEEGANNLGQILVARRGLIALV